MHLLAVGLEDTLLEHPSSEDLEHPSAFVHALLLGQSLVVLVLDFDEDSRLPTFGLRHSTLNSRLATPSVPGSKLLLGTNDLSRIPFLPLLLLLIDCGCGQCA